MASHGASSCLKLFLVVVNLLFLIVGVAILGVGIYLCTSANLSKFSDVFAGLESLRSLRFILIGCGCVVMLVALCGCVGACKESRCLLIGYLILLLIILIANVAAVALAVAYNKQARAFVVEEMKDRLKRYYGNSTDPASQTFTKGIDSVQTEEKCCGWTGLGQPNFFQSTPWFQQQQASMGPKAQHFPDSCCGSGVLDDPDKKNQCVRPEDEMKSRDNGYIHADDCSDKLIALNSRFMHAVLGTVILAILLQIICVTCSIVILRQVSRDGGRVV